MFDTFSKRQRERMDAILELILNEKMITRAKLASALKMSSSSIVKYLKILFDIGLVRESEKELATGGRRSVLLEFNPEIGLNIAVVLDASAVSGALIDATGCIVETESAPVCYGIPRDELVAVLFRVADALVTRAEKARKKVFGVGIGIGGFIDQKRGISRKYLFSTGWYDVPLKKMMEERLGIPCFLLKDVNAFALGEKYYGKGVGVRHFLSVWLGEGIGIGIVANGDLYTGAQDHAGELGHTQADGSDALCYCGHRGCLEVVTSQSHLLEECRRGLQQGVHSDMRRGCQERIEDLTIAQVISAAEGGDRLARNILEREAEGIGRRLSDVVTVLNPDLIILRGPLIDGNRFLFENVKRIVMNATLQETAAELQIAYSEEKEDIRLKGICAYMLREYFIR
jgi:predicted NBD/HSP70 family sugar kinase